MLAPGNYRSLDVERGGKLMLSNGQYGFTDIDIDAGSAVEVPDASGGVSLFAEDDLSFRADVTTAAGVAAPLLLGNASHERIELEAPFWGIAVAPYATLVLGEGCRGASPWRRSVVTALPFASTMRNQTSTLPERWSCQTTPKR